MFREFSEIPEEANLDSVERLKDKYQLSVKEMIDILGKIGRKDLARDIAMEEESPSKTWMRRYYKSGKFAVYQENRQGKRNGTYLQFRSDGTLEQEVSYKNGKEDGIERWYRDDGTLEYEIPYKNGKKEGIGKWYRTDGTLSSESPYENNKIEGIVKWYRDDGTLEYEIPYKNDKKEGIGKWYRDDGTLEAETPYKNGVKDGIKKWYRSDGTLEQETPYTNGEQTGIQKQYRTDGTLLVMNELKNGEFHGIAIQYRSDGSKSYETVFENSEPIGLSRVFDKDGKTVVREEPYNGTINLYDKNGEVVRQDKYVDGVRVESEKMSSTLSNLSQKNAQTAPEPTPQKNETIARGHSPEPLQPQQEQTQSKDTAPQTPNWEMVGEGKTEVLIPSVEEFKKARRAKQESDEKHGSSAQPAVVSEKTLEGQAIEARKQFKEEASSYREKHAENISNEEILNVVSKVAEQAPQSQTMDQPQAPQPNISNTAQNLNENISMTVGSGTVAYDSVSGNGSEPLAPRPVMPNSQFSVDFSSSKGIHQGTNGAYVANFGEYGAGMYYDNDSNSNPLDVHFSQQAPAPVLPKDVAKMDPNESLLGIDPSEPVRPPVLPSKQDLMRSDQQKQPPAHVVDPRVNPKDGGR